MSEVAQSLCLLGATGSIGQSTLDVIRQHPDRFNLHSIAANKNWEQLLPIIEEFEVQEVCLWDESAAESIQKKSSVKTFQGMDGLRSLVKSDNIDYVLNGLVGAIGCEPTLEAINSHKKIGLANKETMVMAGDIINRALKDHPESQLIPIDSEHSAIFQCLAGRPDYEVEKIILTASGGPFRTLALDKFKDITKASALKHPTWDMGPKITIDSATMMNKGLEVIEAHYLFNIEFDNIEIIIHPTSTVHSFVQFQDGSLMAQLGSPDMKLPIQYALTFPERLALNIERLDISAQKILEFFPPDSNKFPCMDLAYTAGYMGGTAPAVLNAANEVVVAKFLEEKISFNQIPETLRTVLEKGKIVQSPQLEDVLQADNWARETANEILKLKGIHA